MCPAPLVRDSGHCLSREEPEIALWASVSVSRLGKGVPRTTPCTGRRYRTAALLPVEQGQKHPQHRGCDMSRRSEERDRENRIMIRLRRSEIGTIGWRGATSSEPEARRGSTWFTMLLQLTLHRRGLLRRPRRHSATEERRCVGGLRSCPHIALRMSAPSAAPARRIAAPPGSPGWSGRPAPPGIAPGRLDSGDVWCGRSLAGAACGRRHRPRRGRAEPQVRGGVSALPGREWRVEGGSRGGRS